MKKVMVKYKDMYLFISEKNNDETEKDIESTSMN